MVEPCLQEWANNVRFQLINDPARKQYSQRVREYGLDFLDAYLDDVLQQDNVLDIFKTPGRKRASPKKQRAPPSRQLHAISEQENTDDDVFNDPQPPTQLKPKKLNNRAIKKTLKTTSHPPSSDREAVIPKASSPPAIIITTEPSPPTEKSGSLAPPPAQEQRDLSIIAEDEEPAERLPAVVPPPPLPAVPNQSPPQIDTSKAQTTSAKTATGSSVPLQRKTPSPQPPSPAESESEQPLQVEAAHEERAQEQPKQSEGPQPGPEHEIDLPPSSQFEEMETYEAPLKDEEDTIQRKPTATYQSLPAPPPLRKSTRVARDPSMPVAPGMFAPVTPAPMTAPGMGKRTSWLSRVREARAMENANKPGSAPPPTVHNVTGPSSKSKRKSGEGDDGVNFDEESSGRKPKLQKIESDEPQQVGSQQMEATSSKDVGTEELDSSAADLGLTALKKRIEDQRNKATGKPLDGVAAANIIAKTAEARAAVLASLADPEASTESLSLTRSNEQRESQGSSKSESSRHTRFSISELSTPAQLPLSLPRVESHSQRVSTTPPHSPPQAPVIPPPRPVFSKPPALAPVFSPPSPKPAPPSPPRPVTRTFSPPSTTIGLGTRFSPVRSPPLSNRVPSAKLGSPKPVFTKAPELTHEASNHKYEAVTFSEVTIDKAKGADEDDSWPMEDNQTETGFWTYSNVKDDTWSTSQPTTTRHISQPSENETQPISQGASGGFDDIDMDQDVDITEAFTEVRDLDDGIKPTVALVKSSLHVRPESQLSMASSESSNSQPVGFLGQATKFMSSMLGTGKKTKPSGPVKSLQLAAAAAKKHQEEEDKKAARVKEMEQRRQLTMQRKAEEEKARAMEEEKRIREEGERRKREREEHTEKRALKPAAKKEETVAKKPKLAVPESEKKEIKKIPSKPTLATVKSTSSLKAGSSKALPPPPFAQAAPSSAKPTEKVAKPVPGSSKGKAKAPPTDDDMSQPSQMIHQQMAARAKIQMQAPSKSQPSIPSESIELPDINSEYSDSEDEDRKRAYDPPDWAQGDEFVNRLQEQSKINPDDIFGPVRPLKMEEIFKTRSSKFRARSSSANWSGTDRLTVEEEREYAKRMGYIK